MRYNEQVSHLGRVKSKTERKLVRAGRRNEKKEFMTEK